MPPPSPGANTPSSSGNGAPKLINDYVRFQAPSLCDFAHNGPISNLVIVSGKARLARSIVCSLRLSTLPAVSSLAFRCPQLGHGRNCRCEGDYTSKYTQGRDIPNNGRSLLFRSHPDCSFAVLPPVRDRSAQKLECVYLHQIFPSY